MPAAGRPDSKYVRKMHYANPGDVVWQRVTTRCGKRMWVMYTTSDPRYVTCKTCLLILDIPPGELDGC